MEVVVQTLRDERPARPLHALVGIRNDKNWRPMLDRLIPEVDRLMLTVAPSVAPERGCRREERAGWGGPQPKPRPGTRGDSDRDFAPAGKAVKEGPGSWPGRGTSHTCAH